MTTQASEESRPEPAENPDVILRTTSLTKRFGKLVAVKALGVGGIENYSIPADVPVKTVG